MEEQEREEKHALMKKILTAKANNDQQVLNETFNSLIKNEIVNW